MYILQELAFKEYRKTRKVLEYFRLNFALNQRYMTNRTR